MKPTAKRGRTLRSSIVCHRLESSRCISAPSARLGAPVLLRRLAPSSVLFMAAMMFVVVPTSTWAQYTNSTIYTFCSLSGCADGGAPVGNMAFDGQGNLYGAARSGGTPDLGTVYKLTPLSGGGIPWTQTVLHTFCLQSGCSDGSLPESGVILDAGGNIYGTTASGGSTNQAGVVYEMSPPPGGNGPWTETVLYTFCPTAPCTDGYEPMAGLIFDAAGNLYGTTMGGGLYGHGAVYELSPNGGTYTEKVLYSFCRSQGCPDGDAPQNGSLIFDAAGNLYDTTHGGGANNYGIVYKLSPSGGGQWNETILYSFCSVANCADGQNPLGGVVFDAQGNLYGGTPGGGANNQGAVYELIPNGNGWVETVLHSFCFSCADGREIEQTLTLDRNGNIFSVAYAGGVNGHGLAFELSQSNGSWNETVLYNFCSVGSCLDGAQPITPLLFDSAGDLYGGASAGLQGGGVAFELVNHAPAGVQFAALTPCRVVDTRGADGTFGGPIMGANVTRAFPIGQSGNPCNIPSTAVAYSLNVTVVPQRSLGYLTIWPTGEGQPVVSTLNSDGRVKANAAIVPAGSPSGSVSVYVSDTTHVIIDIDGYFTGSGGGGGSTLAYYPLTPCRVADTRGVNGPLGGPYLHAQVPRDFPILDATGCNIPGSAQGYSLNFTAVPHGPLGYLTVWPAGQTQPVVSTLNASTGAVTANAAIVPSGSGGAISTYAYNDTDLIIDIDGYFAPAGQGGLSLYPVTPCRVIDTRSNNGQPFNGELVVQVEGSACAPPATAQAYVFNATVIPVGSLGYLTLWPDGGNQPGVSTLNAYDGAITSNMAIVPNANGKTDAYAYGVTQLILDISSYFAP